MNLFKTKVLTVHVLTPLLSTAPRNYTIKISKTLLIANPVASNMLSRYGHPVFLLEITAEWSELVLHIQEF